MPIEILQYGVKVRDPTTHQFSGLATLRGGQGAQGPTGPGVPAGGTDGDVLVKDGTADYDGRWTNTPKLMGNLAYINTGVTADKLYSPGEYLVYNGGLYVVTNSISPDETLLIGTNIDISKVCEKAVTIMTGTDATSEISYYAFANNHTCTCGFIRESTGTAQSGWYYLGNPIPARYRPRQTLTAYFIGGDNKIVRFRVALSGTLQLYSPPTGQIGGFITFSI